MIESRRKHNFQRSDHTIIAIKSWIYESDTQRESSIPQWTSDTLYSKFEKETIKRVHSYLCNDDSRISMSGRRNIFSRDITRSS